LDQDGDGAEDYLMGDRAAGAIDLRSGATGARIRSIPSPADESGNGLFALARAGDRDGDAKEDFWAGAVVTGAAYLLNGTGTVLLQVSDPGPAVPGENGFGSRLAARRISMATPSRTCSLPSLDRPSPASARQGPCI
jgi:hypothetical protein